MENENPISEQPKKIYRSKVERMIGGVCGGIAEYFNIDALLVRLAWIFATLFAGAGILGYIACLILIPDNPYQETPEKVKQKTSESAKFWGIFLIIIGALFLLQQTGLFYRFHFWHIQWQAIFAIAFVGMGIYLLINRQSNSEKETKGDNNNTDKAEKKRPFYRIDEGKMLAGVCTGLSAYFDIDVTLIRLLWVFITLTSAGVGIVAYVIAIIALPSIQDKNHLDSIGVKK